MEYTLIFVFDYSLKNVLLVEKNRGPYVGYLNGVGGKVDLSDSSLEEAALRELKEETGISSAGLKELRWLTTNSYPSDTILHVYYGQLVDAIDFIQVEDEPLSWVPVEDIVDIRDTRFAGEGNVCYYVNASILQLKAVEK